MIRRRKFSRHLQEVYQLPIVVSDSGSPILSSTSTLTIRVCACERNGKVRTCSTKAYLSAAGLSTGALIAILLCIVILLGKPYVEENNNNNNESKLVPEVLGRWKKKSSTNWMMMNWQLVSESLRNNCRKQMAD